MKLPRWKMSRLRPSQGGKFADPCSPPQEEVDEVRRGKTAEQEGIAAVGNFVGKKSFPFLAETYFDDLPGAFFDPSIIKHKVEGREREEYSAGTSDKGNRVYGRKRG